MKVNDIMIEIDYIKNFLQKEGVSYLNINETIETISNLKYNPTLYATCRGTVQVEYKREDNAFLEIEFLLNEVVIYIIGEEERKIKRKKNSIEINSIIDNFLSYSELE